MVVLERATYHTPLTENTRPPRSCWTKDDLVQAIMRWGGPSRDWLSDWRTSRKVTKSILMDHAKRIAPIPKYVVQDLADSFSDGDFCIKILFLLVAHPELNPIKMVRRCVKREVAKSNFHFKLSALKAQATTEMEKVGHQLFSC